MGAVFSRVPPDTTTVADGNTGAITSGAERAGVSQARPLLVLTQSDFPFPFLLEESQRYGRSVQQQVPPDTTTVADGNTRPITSDAQRFGNSQPVSKDRISNRFPNAGFFQPVLHPVSKPVLETVLHPASKTRLSNRFCLRSSSTPEWTQCALRTLALPPSVVDVQHISPVHELAARLPLPLPVRIAKRYGRSVPPNTTTVADGKAADQSRATPNEERLQSVSQKPVFPAPT